MFCSQLWVNIGTDPHHPRPGHSWLRNRYHVHQRLCMAFPRNSQKESDPEFLKPFEPDGFAGFQGFQSQSSQFYVRCPRSQESGFTYRIEIEPTPRILVQSAAWPDWKYAFHNSPELIANIEGPREFNPEYPGRTRLRFRLLVNPTRRMARFESDGIQRRQWCNDKGNGKRVELKTNNDLLAWLKRQGEVRNDKKGGFSLIEARVTPAGIVRGFKRIGVGRGEVAGHRLTLSAVRFDGILEVTDPVAFRNTLFAGIGSGKAFGFGLLSVAPLRD